MNFLSRLRLHFSRITFCSGRNPTRFHFVFTLFSRWKLWELLLLIIFLWGKFQPCHFPTKCFPLVFLLVVRIFSAFCLLVRNDLLRGLHGRTQSKAINCQNAINFPRVLLCENWQLKREQKIDWIYFRRLDCVRFLFVDSIDALMVNLRKWADEQKASRKASNYQPDYGWDKSELSVT